MSARQPSRPPVSFTVRTPDGSMEYANISDLARAYATGMIDSEDEIRDGQGAWLRADEFARQRALPLPARPKKLGGYAGHALVGVGLAAVIIYLVAKDQMVAALCLGVVVCLLMTRVTVSAFRPRS